MRTGLSVPAIQIAKTVPPVAKAGLRIAARVLRARKPHWVLRKIASEIGYRVAVDTRLGNGMAIRVFWVDVVGWDICTQGYYEPETVRVVGDVVAERMVFLDVGSHVGQYTLIAAHLGATVHAFEADPETFAVLRHNVEVNRLTRVTVNHAAVLDHSGVETFYVGAADKVAVGSILASRDTRRRVRVPCIALDEYVERERIGRVDVVKIDVEGAEIAVLKGARRMLTHDPRPKIVLEFSNENQARFGASCGELSARLRSLKYRLFRIEESGLTPYEARQYEPIFFNVLAVPE